VKALLALGPLPASEDASEETLRALEDALHRVSPPLADDEARKLVALFGPDDCFGLGWTLLHLIETAPGWPIEESLHDTSSEWVARLRERTGRGNAPHVS